MAIDLNDVVNHHNATTAKRNAREDAKLKDAVSTVLDKAMRLANAGHISFDDRLAGIQAMTNPTTGTTDPLALPSGKSPEQQALETLLNSSDPKMTEGVKNLLRRVFIANPGDSVHIPVDDQGTPVELTKLRNEKAAVADELARERDESVPDSLAHKLANATTAPAPADMVKKEDIRPLVKTANEAWDQAHVARMSDKTVVKPDAAKKIDEALDQLQELVKA